MGTSQSVSTITGQKYPSTSGRLDWSVQTTLVAVMTSLMAIDGDTSCHSHESFSLFGNWNHAQQFTQLTTSLILVLRQVIHGLVGRRRGRGLPRPQGGLLLEALGDDATPTQVCCGRGVLFIVEGGVLFGDLTRSYHL